MSDPKKSLKTYLLSVAESFDTITEAELRDAVAAALQADDFDELWQLVEPWLVRSSGPGVSLSEHTLRNYRTAMRMFVQWARAAGVSITMPRPKMGILYIQGLAARGAKPSTIRGRVAAAQHLYALLRHAGVTRAHPFADVSTPRDQRPDYLKRAPYRDSSVRSLAAVADNPEDEAIVLLGAHAGLRVSEMLGLTWSDITSDGDVTRVTVNESKGGVSRSVAMSDRLTGVLEALRSTAPDREHVLSLRSPSAIRNRLRALATAAGVRYLGVHSLRHTAGTRLYRETGDLQAVAEFLGHRSVSSVQVYTRHAAHETPPVRDWD